MQHTNCDTAIKLFGMKIPFQAEEESSERDLGFETLTENKDSKIETETKSDQPLDSPNSNNPNTPSIHEEDPNSKTEAKLKKPDKILPCPRCSSMDTKFCYYNNYNVHQPRHFCKACQRYWTAGGTMRNVPVGAGRRKNKSSSFAAAQPPPPPPPNFHLIPESDRCCSTASSITTLSNSEESSSVVAAATSAPYLPWPLYPGIPMPFPHPCWWFPPPPTMPAVVMGSKRPREGCVLVPKTLRFDDPDEAAKSSIWATLGIKMEGARMFDGFQSKSRKGEFGRDDDDDEKKKKITNASKASPVLMANPAALSRSINFHESS